MATSISHSPEETQALGETWGREATSGLVIALTGDLGAGKTQLAKGVARGLGITTLVHSPTFALVNEYAGGRLPLFHVDLYRLDTPEQILGAGIEEFFHPKGVTVVEWAEKFPGFEELSASGRLRRVTLEVLDETNRRITYEDSGN